MTTTLNDGAGYTVTPLQVLGFQTTFKGQNIFHTTLAGGLDVTLIPATLRAGRFEFLFDNEQDAANCVTMHTGTDGSGVFQISDDDVMLANFFYVLSGDVSPALEDQTRSLWTVSVDYQEVPTS